MRCAYIQRARQVDLDDRQTDVAAVYGSVSVFTTACPVSTSITLKLKFRARPFDSLSSGRVRYARVLSKLKAASKVIVEQSLIV